MNRKDNDLGRFAILVASLMLLVVLTALDAELHFESLRVRVALTIVLVAGVYASINHRWVLAGALVLVMAPLGGNWAAQFVRSEFLDVVRQTGTVLFLSYVGVLVLYEIHDELEVSLDTVLGGVAVYLLIGIIYISIYEIVIHLAPGSFLFQGRDLEEVIGDPNSIHGLSVLMYYSFVTLTTLGYGDVTPVRPMAQMLSTSEAIVGQLFVAIFIARLVALYTRSVADRRS